MKSKNSEISANSNRLEWGNHNPKLTDLNFIDRNPKKRSSVVVPTDEISKKDFKRDQKLSV